MEFIDQFVSSLYARRTHSSGIICWWASMIRILLNGVRIAYALIYSIDMNAQTLHASNAYSLRCPNRRRPFPNLNGSNVLYCACLETVPIFGPNELNSDLFGTFMIVSISAWVWDAWWFHSYFKYYLDMRHDNDRFTGLFLFWHFVLNFVFLVSFYFRSIQSVSSFVHLLFKNGISIIQLVSSKMENDKRKQLG